MTSPNPPAPRDPGSLAIAAELDEAVRAGFPAGAPHRAVVQHLVSASLFPEAVRLVAFALPRRESVWWAWVSAKRASGPEPAGPIKAALEATERWIAQPTDPNRRLAWERAQVADLGTPAGCAGAAAFFAGDSVAPPNVQALPPGEFDCAKMVTAAVLLSVLAGDPAEAPVRFVAAIQQGLDVAAKIRLWPGDDGAPLQPPAPKPPAENTASTKTPPRKKPLSPSPA